MRSAVGAKEGGFSLLSVLFGSVFLGIFVLTTFYLVLSLVTVYAGEIHSMLAKDIARSSLVEQLFKAPAAGPGLRLICQSGTGEKGRHEITRSACTLVNLATEDIMTRPRIDGAELEDPSSFPLINYNVLFNTPSSCALQDDADTQISALGFPLTPSALRSSLVCPTMPAGQLASFVSASNLALNEALSAPTLLAAQGYIDINTTVLVDQEALIVAGGDLHIKTIITDSTTPALLTLISASGVVSIEEVPLGLPVKVIAARGIFVPPGIPSATGSALLRFLNREILGFWRG